MSKYRVPKTAITERGLKKLLRDAIKKNSSASEWAVENGITPQAVSAFFRKTQGAGLQIPEKLGYRPQIVYLPVDEELISTPMPPRRATKKPTSKVDHSRPPIEKPGKDPTSKSEVIRKLKEKRRK